MAKYNEVRDALIRLCKEDGIEARDGDYQVELAECTAHLAMKYKLPLAFAEIMIANAVFEGLFSIRQSPRSKKWYVIIGEGLCLRSKGVVNGD